jgi:hypothetical protein|nr:MAG TPA: Portal protein, Peptidoglycan hydrolase gp4, portal, tailspike, adhesin, VIRAL.5A [Caudoviricetes sp.]
MADIKSKDRRKEFSDKVNVLQAQKQELEAKGEEIAQADSGEESMAQDHALQSTADTDTTDRRAEFAERTQQLYSMQQDLQNKSDDIARKGTTGADGMSPALASQPASAVDSNKVREFTQILEKYKEGKKNLDERIKNNQEWWKLRHYGNMSPKTGTAAANDKSQKNTARPKSVTAWTVNSVINKHADYMDNYPEAACLPVEAADEEYANTLSSVIPAIYERCNFEQTYSDEMWYKLIAGTGVLGYFWDKDLLNGLGDIAIRKCDILNLFWEPGISDIQESEYFFHTQLMSNHKIRNMFPDIPELKTRLSNPTVNVTTYNYDDTVETSEHSMIVDVYYHRVNASGNTVLHYCKYVNDIVLFASENMEQYAETGYYRHGRYPFVFDTMFPVEGSPCGFGYIDIVKEVQKDIDELNDDFMHNAKEASHRRYIVNNASNINEDELIDVTREIIHAEGNSLDEGNFKELVTNPLDGIYMGLLQQRIDEIKEVSNNRDVSSGGTTSGATAASAIAAMQEAGSKTSRDQESSSYRSFKEGCYFVIELMAENYEETRYFRITGQNGEQQFVGFNNSGIKPQVETDPQTGIETSRKPIFDIKVKPQKRSQYSTISQNELMKELWGAGVFNPQNATQAVVLVQLMEFEGREKLLQILSQNGTIYQQLMQYQQIVMTMAQQLDALTGSQYTAQVQMAVQAGQVPMISGLGGQGGKTSDTMSSATNGNSIVDKAREESRQRSEVRR